MKQQEHIAMTERDTVPLDVLFDPTGTGPNWSGTHLKALDEVDVIIGLDKITRHEFIVFGREKIQKISEGHELGADVMFIQIDERTDDLDRLASLVETLKGYHEYRKVGPTR